MNKRKLVILFLVVFLGLSISIYQYAQMFYSEIASATAPNPGHAWSEMECTNDLCVDTTNHKIGIGTISPSESLEVVGDILSSGDVCNGSGKCLNAAYQTNVIAGSNPVCPAGQTMIMKAYNGTWYTADNASITSWNKITCGAQVTNDGTPLLVNGLHTGKNCTDANGTVVSDTSGNKMCRFDVADCSSISSGWNQYQNWSSTTTKVNIWPGTAPNCGSYGQICVCYGESTCTYTGHTWQNLPIECCSVTYYVNNCGTGINRTNSACGVKTQVGCY